MQDFDDGSPAIAQQPMGSHRQPLMAASPRRAPLPEVFGAGCGFWLKDQPRGEFVFARAAGQKPVSAQAARAYLRGMLQKAGIEKKISPHKLRHTYATNLLNAGAERVDIKALLGHESIATTQIYTNVGQERMEQVVGRL
jgi:integrase/recombinase XerD